MDKDKGKCCVTLVFADTKDAYEKSLARVTDEWSEGKREDCLDEESVKWVREPDDQHEDLRKLLVGARLCDCDMVCYFPLNDDDEK